jgi:hypothetical protein
MESRVEVDTVVTKYNTINKSEAVSTFLKSKMVFSPGEIDEKLKKAELGTNLDVFESSINQMEDHKHLVEKSNCLQKLVDNDGEKNNALNLKMKELFELESKIEEEEREAEKEKINHEDTLHHKDELFSSFENNQNRVIKDLKIQYEGIMS